MHATRLPISFLFFFSVAVVALYLLGLPGIFILDDIHNLEGLRQVAAGGLDEFANFVLSGSAGPLGRPFTLLTFALQADAWPHSPSQFLVVNVLIHVANGWLLFLLTYLLLVRLRLSVHPSWIAACVAAAWMIAPQHAISTLYIVQRMTLLSAFWMLVALCAFSALRTLELARGRVLPLAGVTILAAVLSILSKENGVLVLPALLLLELCVFSAGTRRASTLLWMCCGMGLVAALILVQVGVLDRFLESYKYRDFTLLERLLSQGRVLFIYVENLFLPRASALSVFNDDFHAVATEELALADWLLAFAHVAMMLGALWLHRRAPLLAFGVLFFYLAHSLESSIFPLEIYFEHRNYLPSVGLFLALTHVIGVLDRHLPSKARRLAASLGIVWLIVVALVLAQVTVTWSNFTLQSRVWAEERGGSLRASLNWLRLALERGAIDESRAFSQRIRERFSNPPELESILLLASCYDRQSPEYRADSIVAAAADLRYSAGIYRILDRLLVRLENGECPHVSPSLALTLTKRILQQPMPDKNAHRNFLMIASRASVLAGDLREAIVYADRAAEIQDDGTIAAVQSLWLTYAGAEEYADYYSDLARERSRSAPWHVREKIHEILARVNALQENHPHNTPDKTK